MVLETKYVGVFPVLLIPKSSISTVFQWEEKVIILEDVNGDGKADKRTVFFEHPSMKAPMGLLLGENCVLLAQAPHLIDVICYRSR